MGVILAAVFVLAFFGAVVPLLTGGTGAARAEVNGHFPAQVGLGQTVQVPLAVDNTGDSVIGPLCLRASVDPASVVTPVEVNFQGLDTVPFTRGEACGGSLSGGEVITAKVSIRGAATGSARVTMVVTLQGREVGPQLHAIVAVAAAQG